MFIVKPFCAFCIISVMFLPLKIAAEEVSTGDIDVVISDGADYSVNLTINSPSNNDLATLKLKYGLWNSPDTTTNIFINNTFVGTILATNAYISDGPAYETFDISGSLINGSNVVTFDTEPTDGDWMLGKVDIFYTDDGNNVCLTDPSLPECDLCTIDPESCDPCAYDPASCEDPCDYDPESCDPCLTDPDSCLEEPESFNQIIKVANTPKGVLGRTSVLEVSYDTGDSNNQLTGLGMRVHFNSTLLSFKEITNLIEQDIIVNGQGPFSDEDDFDNDPLTDQYISFGWASLLGNWPDVDLPAVLMNIAFDVSDAIDLDITTETSINFSDSALASGYQFESESYNLELVSTSWDFDGSGHADALTDGLMMLRYCFGLRGTFVTDSAMSPDSTMSSEQVVAEIESALTMADIDDDGEVGALTDGLMLLRYLFGLRGDQITASAVGTNANRTSNEAIEAYLEAYMPAM